MRERAGTSGLPYALSPLPLPRHRVAESGGQRLARPLIVALVVAVIVLSAALTLETRTGQHERATLVQQTAATEATLLRHLSDLNARDDALQQELLTVRGALAARGLQAEELRRALATERQVALLAAASSEAQVDRTAGELASWRQHADERQAERDARQAERDALAEQLQQREAELADLQAAMATLQPRVAETEALARRLRQTLGLPQPTGPAGGDSAAPPAEAVSMAEQAASIEARWAAAAADLIALERAFNARLTALRSLATAGQPARLSAAAAAIAPTGWPVVGPLSSTFGPRISPIDEQMRFHGGVDIVVNSGTAVRATQAGQVTQAAMHPDYGLVVVVRHAGGFETLYGHNSQLLVRPGQTVERGQTIARSGTTGVSTGPHLHYEVRYQGVALDPVPLLRADVPWVAR